MTNEMMTFPLAQNKFPAKKHLNGEAFQSTWMLWRMGAILCFAGGFLSVALGILLIVITWFTASAVSSVIARVAIIETLPLMMFGAHCLDKLDFIEKAARKKRLGI
ncbi:MAG TPA: hypothetical protein VGB02_01015 [Pyrinomonadaceae bacterium]